MKLSIKKKGGTLQFSDHDYCDAINHVIMDHDHVGEDGGLCVLLKSNNNCISSSLYKFRQNEKSSYFRINHRDQILSF